MKKQLIALMTGTMLLVATSALALTVSGGTNVGVRDKFFASADLGNSGDATELAWIQGELGSAFTWATDGKYDVKASNWLLTDEAGGNTWALNLKDSPQYYMIKTGTGANDPVNDHFLFENMASLEWAVLNLSADFGTGYEIKNIGKVSHVNEIGGGTPVPEPGTMMLLGVGMFGLAIFGKRRMNKES